MGIMPSLNTEAMALARRAVVALETIAKALDAGATPECCCRDGVPRCGMCAGHKHNQCQVR